MEKQIDTMVEMLSEHRAGAKLKRISIKHSKDSDPFPNLSAMRFVFEGEENKERVVIVWGKDLGVGFGSQGV